MDIEKVDGPLRTTADLFWSIAIRLNGHPPEPFDGWYKLERTRGSGYAWIRIIGTRARRYPPNSLHLVVPPHANYANDSRFATGKDWWGKEDRHVVILPQDTTSIACGIELLTRAFQAHQPR